MLEAEDGWAVFGDARSEKVVSGGSLVSDRILLSSRNLGGRGPRQHLLADWWSLVR